MCVSVPSVLCVSTQEVRSQQEVYKASLQDAASRGSNRLFSGNLESAMASIPTYAHVATNRRGKKNVALGCCFVGFQTAWTHQANLRPLYGKALSPPQLYQLLPWGVTATRTSCILRGDASHTQKYTGRTWWRAQWPRCCRKTEMQRSDPR